jgi:hypothetical protein
MAGVDNGKLVTQAEATCKVEDELGVGTGLAARLDHPLPQLHVRLGLGTNLEAYLERLTLEWAGHGEHHVGQLGCRVHKKVGVNVEVERGQGLAPSLAVGVGKEKIGAEPDERTYGVGLLFEDASV